MVAAKRRQYHPERMSLVGHGWDVLMPASPRDAVRLLPSPRVGGCARPARGGRVAGRGRPPQAAARRAGLEFVEKLLTRTSPARTRRSGTRACFASRFVAALVGLATGPSRSACVVHVTRVRASRSER